jgi:DNA-binding transcriptional MerR regulator
MEKDTLGRLLSIGGVARETGLSEDTLRMWERRYGFPTPLRDASGGHRRYPEEQVERLRRVKALVDDGFRPGKVVRASNVKVETPIMPRGDKQAYTGKQKRQATHIEQGYAARGVSEDQAKARAWATVNKLSGGGKQSGSGRKKASSAKRKTTGRA